MKRIHKYPVCSDELNSMKRINRRFNRVCGKIAERRKGC